MAAQIVTLPLRLSMRTAGLFVRVAEQAVGRAFTIADDLVQVVSRRSAPPGGETPAEPVDVARSMADVAGMDVADVVVEPEEGAATIDLDAPGWAGAHSNEPTHVSEEPELVEEFAEPGAEDGAGAQVTVSEPWTGYRRMTAQDVVDRLSDATPAELAAVQLYEREHRERATVLAAVERRLKHASGGPD